MSVPYLPPNKSKQQEAEHAHKQMSKVVDEQTPSDNAIENMSEEDYTRFREDNENKRQALVEVERGKRKRATLLLYISILLGAISVLAAQSELNPASLSGWIAIVLAIISIGLLAKASIGPYGSGFGWRGILSFFLALLGIILGFGTLGGAIIPY